VAETGEAKNKLFLRLAGLCGILGSVLPLFMVLLATFLSTWFSWNENALSELGVGGQSLLFNSAMLIGGALNFLFALGLYKYLGREKLISKKSLERFLKKRISKLIGGFKGFTTI